MACANSEHLSDAQSFQFASINYSMGQAKSEDLINYAVRQADQSLYSYRHIFMVDFIMCE